jgi:hypothetical protein
MRNLHAWKHRTEDGARREVRAEKFGGKWTLRSKLAGEERWTHHDPPLLADLVELREVLWRKYQRKHLAWEDVAAVEKLMRDRNR